jgi:hypothetical protein
MLAQQQQMRVLHQQGVPQGIVRPSPLPANAPTEQDILAGRVPDPMGFPRAVNPLAAMVAHEQQQQFLRHQLHQEQQRLMRPRGFEVPPPHLAPQLPGGAQPPPLDLLQMIHQTPPNREVMQTPEAATLQRALERGDATTAGLIASFTHAQLAPPQREILLNVLKAQQESGRLPTRMTHQQQMALAAGQQLVAPPPHLGPPGGHSSRHSPHHELAALQHMQQQQQQQQHYFQQGGHQGRRPQPPKPSPCGQLSVSPASLGQQRIPSPQEIQHHAQQVYQNALIRRKLEEQRENFRRKQESSIAGGAKSGQGMRARANSDASKQQDTDSPLGMSPFTPTVVMKKMAADRRDSDPRLQVPELKVSQSSEVDGRGADGDGLPTGGRRSASPSTAQGGMMPHVPLPPQRQSPMSTDQRFLPPQQAMSLGQALGGFGRGASPEGGGLARFFSPEVLAQAGTGPGPILPPLPVQQAMTLEEIEKQASGH